MSISREKTELTADNDGSGREYLIVLRGLPFIAMLVEIGLFAAWIDGRIDFLSMLLGHCGVLVFVVVTIVALDSRRVDTGVLQLFLLAVAAGGPVGAFVANLIWYPRSIKVTGALQSWYDTIAPPQRMAVTLYDQIRDGRSVQVNAYMPKRFDRILKKGTLREKQALLSYLAINYNPDHANILRMAMDSSEPAVRVQASAVAANLRMRAKLAPSPRPGTLQVDSGTFDDTPPLGSADEKANGDAKSISTRVAG